MVSRVVYSNLKKLKLARQTSEWNKTKSRFRQQITNEAKISNKQCIKTRLQYLQRAQQCTRLSLFWNVRMKKNSLGDWSCNNLSDENPQGTPDPVTGPQGWRTRSTLFDFWQATLYHIFFSFSRLQTPQGQWNRYNRSCAYLSFSRRQRKLSVLMRCLF